MNYQIEVETHCHTVASVHAYSTVGEYVAEAKAKGMKGVAITDHAPALPDAPMEWHFSCQRVIPRITDGIFCFYGAELSITDYCGAVDLGDETLINLDFVIASIHHPVLPQSSEADITNAYIGAISGTYVDCIGHMGQGAYMCDYEKILSTVKALGKTVEINNHSFNMRKGSLENCTKIAQICKDMEIPIVVSSDAHFHKNLGEYPHAISMLKSINFPQELILNSTLEKFCAFIERRRGYNILDLCGN